MHRVTMIYSGAALVLVPLVSTCTTPQGMMATAHEHVGTASEDRLVGFLIDGPSPAAQVQSSR